MLIRSSCVFAALSPLLAQAPPPPSGPQPIFRVNIVERTTPALNYGHLTEATKIGFRGTALLPLAQGEATIETKRGAVLVNAHFEHVPAPARFGREYLTYVVWAISPDGRAQNLGELVLNGSDKGSLTASTAMQAFALIVTAEPYFAVTRPSDVVVMENRVRPDTVGKVEEVNATYELLPRTGRTYTYDESAAAARTAGGYQVSMPVYEAITARYQAQNAIQIALAAGAQQYAPERIDRAQQLLAASERLDSKELSKDVVATAREAAQVAEDARLIALRRAQEERLARDRREQQELQAKAEHDRELADIAAQRAQLQAERARLEEERAAVERARIQANAQAAAAAPADTHEAATADRMRTAATEDETARRANRARLTASLRASFNTLDTPRGVVVIIPDSLLDTAEGAARVRMRLAAVQSVLTAWPGLRFEVDGYSDTPAGAAATDMRAEQVRGMLIAEGIPPASVISNGYGASRPLSSNATVSGREQNRRVEIVINGAAIGDTPTWDHAYPIAPGSR
ncbi:MAG TPA: OmpA family protein [Bryobacteraceae bacterium]|nr:OmpA family protein [Bryobacteraceae bacterium]